MCLFALSPAIVWILLRVYTEWDIVNGLCVSVYSKLKINAWFQSNMNVQLKILLSDLMLLRP